MKPADVWVITQYFSGAPSATPTATLNHNGVADATTVAVAQVGSTNGYTFTVTIPSTGSYAEDVVIELVATATVASVTQTQVIARDMIHVGCLPLLAGALGLSQLSADAMAMLSRGHLSTFGVTVPATADAEWTIAGLYVATTGTLAANPYYLGKNLGLFAWTDGTFFYLSSTAPGVTLPANYFKTASGAGVAGPYALVGTGSGIPAVTYHGNAVLNTVQPNINPATNAQAVAILTNPDTAGTASILAAINASQTGGPIVGTPTPALFVVSGLVIPSTNLPTMLCVLFDGTTGLIKGELPIATATGSGSITLGFASPGFAAIAAGDTVKVRS